MDDIKLTIIILSNLVFFGSCFVITYACICCKNPELENEENEDNEDNENNLNEINQELPVERVDNDITCEISNNYLFSSFYENQEYSETDL